MKTTRVRALGGEQIVFSNGDLLKSRIRNYKTQRERRVVFTIGVAYETPADVVATIPAMLREIVGAESPVRVERAHFKGFGQSSLDFEVVYWVLDPDYLKYMDIQQSVNLAIMRRFAERRIAFALPVRTIHVASGSIGVPEPPKRIPARAG